MGPWVQCPVPHKHIKVGVVAPRAGGSKRISSSFKVRQHRELEATQFRGRGFGAYSPPWPVRKGTKACQTARMQRLHFTRAGNREKEQEVGPGCKAGKPAPNAIFPPARLLHRKFLAPSQTALPPRDVHIPESAGVVPTEAPCHAAVLCLCRVLV